MTLIAVVVSVMFIFVLTTSFATQRQHQQQRQLQPRALSLPAIGGGTTGSAAIPIAGGGGGGDSGIVIGHSSSNKRSSSKSMSSSNGGSSTRSRSKWRRRNIDRWRQRRAATTSNHEFAQIMCNGAAPTIPRTVHFIFGLWESDTTPLTTKHEAALSTWRHYNPGYILKVWRRPELNAVLSAAFPREWAWVTLHVSNHGQLADLTRYMLILAVGGCYADLDVYATGALDASWTRCGRGTSFIAVHESVLSPSEVSAHGINIFTNRPLRPTRVANYFFAAAKGSKVLHDILRLSLSRVRALNQQAKVQNDVIFTTGPDAMTEGFFEGPRALVVGAGVGTGAGAGASAASAASSAASAAAAAVAAAADLGQKSAAARPGAHLASKAEADAVISHHARGTWRMQFAAFRERGSFN